MQQFPQILLNVPVPSKSSAITADIRKEIQITEERLGNDGRVLVRPSGTEPLIRVMVEAVDEALANSEAQRLASVIRSAID
jgi:phosphoglucosamine mutase